MLAGESFGEAIKIARTSTYEEAPESNTWGAYQCYGDPTYRLANTTRAGADVQNRYVAPAEAILDLNTLKSRSQEASERRFEELQEDLRKTVRDIPGEWKKKASIAEAIASAFSELELFDEAIAYYSRLSSIEQAEFTFKALETKANLESRVAFDKWLNPEKRIKGIEEIIEPEEEEGISEAKQKERETKQKEREAKRKEAIEKVKKEALDEVNNALGFLLFITDTQDSFTTAERCSLVGKAYKCLAVMESEHQAKKSKKDAEDEKDHRRSTQLLKAAEYYAKAYNKKSNKRPHLYSGLNFLSIELMLKTFYPEREAEWKKLTLGKGAPKKIETEANTAGERDPGFWNLSAKGDYALYEYLVDLLRKRPSSNI